MYRKHTFTEDRQEEGSRSKYTRESPCMRGEGWRG